LSNEIIEKLEARGVKKDEDQIFEIPNFAYDEISPETFFNNYVKLGRPAIIRGFPTKSLSWSPQYISDKIGNYSTVFRCGPIIKNMTVTGFYFLLHIFLFLM
jgi:hypothetical protein